MTVQLGCWWMQWQRLVKRAVSAPSGLAHLQLAASHSPWLETVEYDVAATASEA